MTTKKNGARHRLGALYRERREALGSPSHRTLAAKSGGAISHTMLWMIGRDRGPQNPSAQLLSTIARVLELPYDRVWAEVYGPDVPAGALAMLSERA